MAERYLMDTCAVIKYLNETFPEAGIAFIDEILEEESLLSFISEIELQVWNPPNPKDLDVYLDFVAASTIFKIDNVIIRETITIRKQFKIKIPDAIVAATALVNDFTLLSDNDKDFLKVSGLKYKNPMKL